MGHFDRLQARREEQAYWMSLLLSAQSGTEVTPAQLLGTEEEEQAARLTEAEQKLEALLPRIQQHLPAAAAQYEVVDEV